MRFQLLDLAGVLEEPAALQVLVFHLASKSAPQRHLARLQVFALRGQHRCVQDLLKLPEHATADRGEHVAHLFGRWAGKPLGKVVPTR